MGLHRKRTIVFASWCVAPALMAASAALAQQEADAGASPDLRWGPNLLDNGDFEEGLEGWHERLGAIQPGAETFSLLATDFGVFHSGGVSLRLQGDIGTTRWRTAESFPIDVVPGRQYSVSGWLKTADIEKEGEQWFNANLYVQFLDPRGAMVPIGVQPVRGTRKLRGTNDWTEVILQVKAPDNAAAVRVGAALTCSGTMWVDDVTLRQASPIEFKRLSTGKFDYFYLGEPPSEESVERNAAFLTQLESTFGMTLEGRVKYFMYTDKEEQLTLTGTVQNNHALGQEIHSVGPNDLHNIAHVLLDQLGMSLPILREGAAYYSTKLRLGGPAHTVAKYLLDKGELEPVAGILSLEAFSEKGGVITKAYGASLVAFLLEKYGPEKFRQFYPYATVVTAPDELPGRAQKVYGMSLSELEAEWHAYLREFKIPGIIKAPEGVELDGGAKPRFRVLPPGGANRTSKPDEDSDGGS